MGPAATLAGLGVKALAVAWCACCFAIWRGLASVTYIRILAVRGLLLLARLCTRMAISATLTAHAAAPEMFRRY